MSRSRKKQPFIKDNCDKKYYNRPFRRTNKVRLQKGLYLLLMNEVVNQWDVCDWRSYCPEYEKVYRK